MIDGLKPYAGATKPKAMIRTSAINIPWLTAIPDHWKVIRAKGLFRARTERARPDDEQLSATQACGIIPQKEFERRVGRKVVQKENQGLSETSRMACPLSYSLPQDSGMWPRRHGESNATST